MAWLVPGLGPGLMVLGAALAVRCPGWGFLLVVVGLWVGLPRRPVFLLGVVLAVYVFASGRRDFDEIAKTRAQLGIGAKSREVVGEVRLGWFEPRSEPVFRATFTGAGVVDCPVRVRFFGQVDEELEPGMRLRVSGKLLAKPQRRNPGSEAAGAPLEEWGLVAGLDVTGSEVLEEKTGAGLARVAFSVRKWARAMVAKDLDGNEEVVVAAMLLGERPLPGSEVLERFRLSGALHVFAVSGLHVNLVGVIFWWGLGWFRCSRRAKAPLVWGGMLAYAAVTGLAPPAVRALLMAGVFLGAFLVRRRPHLLNSLLVSMILVLCWQPLQVSAVSFQLSYLVLGAIAVGYPWFFKKWRWISDGDPFLPTSLAGTWTVRARDWAQRVVTIVASAVPAWLGSVTLAVFVFRLVPVVGLVASVPLILLTSLVLGLGMGGLMVGAIWEPAGGVLLRGAGLVAGLADGLAHAAARVPGGAIAIHGRPPGEVVIFDPADGGSATVAFGEKGAVLVDAGDAFFHQQVMAGALREWGAEPKLVALTHGDASHVGGAGELGLGREEHLRFWWPKKPGPSSALRELRNFAGARGTAPDVGERWPIGGDDFLETVWQADVGKGRANERSAMYLLEKSGWRVLFGGDAPRRSYDQLLEQKPAFRADVVVMGVDDGGQDSFALAAFRGMRARAVVVADRPFAKAEKVGAVTLERANAAGIAVFLQSEVGAVVLKISERELVLTPWLKPDAAVRLPP